MLHLIPKMTFYSSPFYDCLLFSDEEKCFLHNIDYVGGDLTVVKKDSTKECQLHCQQVRGCEAFSYITNSYNGVHGEAAWRSCHLKNTKNGIQENQEGIISGPKFCAGEVTLGF